MVIDAKICWVNCAIFRNILYCLYPYPHCWSSAGLQNNEAMQWVSNASCYGRRFIFLNSIFCGHVIFHPCFFQNLDKCKKSSIIFLHFATKFTVDIFIKMKYYIPTRTFVLFKRMIHSVPRRYYQECMRMKTKQINLSHGIA